MNNNQNNLTVGKDSVVIGEVSGHVGNGSVVIGPTDSNGNTIINRSMAIGSNAKAGPGSIAIGANAGAGSEIFLLLAELKDIIEKSGDIKTTQSVINLIEELKNSKSDATKIGRFWEAIKSVATINGAISLIGRISTLLGL